MPAFAKETSMRTFAVFLGGVVLAFTATVVLEVAFDPNCGLLDRESFQYVAQQQ
jgi:hypothetical protein